VISSKDKGPTDAVYKVELWVWIAASFYFAGISLWRTFVQGDPGHGQDSSDHAT
jgi:hypothetical protein